VESWNLTVKNLFEETPSAEDTSQNTVRNGEECQREASARGPFKPLAHEVLASLLHGKVDARRVLATST